MLKAIERWMDIRPGEMQRVVLCFGGAFLLLAFVVLALSVRDAFFLDVFDIENLPYVNAAVAVLSLPAVGLFASLMARHHPWSVLQKVAILFCIGLGAIWAASRYEDIVAVVLYIWTVIGAMLLTSGFWVLVAESFEVRGAKRLYGLIAAGGTAGAMAMGLSLNWITRRFQLIQLVPFLIGIVILLCLVEFWIYRLSDSAGRSVRLGREALTEDLSDEGGKPSGFLKIRENLGTILKSPYLRSIASIVFVATVASSIVGYQFKEYAEITYFESGERLAAFFGAFYGWTGGIALVVQLFFTARIMGSAGITTGLAILPGLLLFGSAGFLAFPGLWVATLVRGGDYALRKSLLRPMLEFLYVPVPALVRRKTKTFIDSFVDSAAEGTGAAILLLWVELAGGQSRHLSIVVVLMSVALFVLSRRMGKLYLGTIVSRLREGDAGTARPGEKNGLKADLLTASFSRLDLQSMFIDMTDAFRADRKASAGVHKQHGVVEREDSQSGGSTDPPDIASILMSSNDPEIQKVLAEVKRWKTEQIPLLIRLLARDTLQETAAHSLIRAGDSAVSSLRAILENDEADFVIRRRIPRVLAGIGGKEAERSLLRALSAGRFEIRYRAVLALVSVRERGCLIPRGEIKEAVWKAIRNEVQCSRPVWEMRQLLDSIGSGEDDRLVHKRVNTRSDLSLEHTFRMLTLVLDPEPVTAAFQGMLAGDEDFRGYALEYLERALPSDIRERLWLFIGDASEARKRRETRPIQQVISDLMSSRATLFHDETDRDALKKILKK